MEEVHGYIAWPDASGSMAEVSSRQMTLVLQSPVSLKPRAHVSLAQATKRRYLVLQWRPSQIVLGKGSGELRRGHDIAVFMPW